MTPQPGIPDHELDDPQSPVEDHSIEVGLGHRVRALRTSRGMSVAALSERAGLSKAMLSKIENAQTSCSLTSVAHLAAALDVPVATLFQDSSVERPVAYTPAGKGTLIDGRGTRHNHIYELLGSFRGRGGSASGPHLEPVLVTLNNRSETYPRFQHPGTELLYMLDGDMTYRYQETDYRMQPGDALLLDGEGVHGPTGLTELPIRFLAITAYPTDTTGAPAD
ncbi:helix-turn-helix domain-containing protein [Corynebacterium variabile]|uniref:helix-turn-helix domain-containing protein n=1 Tax=Corynebacterium variabile TaxID=1727 RepID=UPI002647B8E8|nr:XRE family transcriptional regulator [Corynebacterium variabile]MDN6239948.1 XRE family transcriptional regulator [Corynebacterium variabile]MDN6478357.1 XRE family transcriptional regulator [Corynebacterium variabile]MDN6677616.1 XRE family transcriptional regulator [Corynebacterium variabile]MDN6815128.1 XRE family transcriptional regulator [Corynebacterium variabile]MDN6845527.1 XRE family transcriptional regulator [Corynebacterium variabile]